MIRLLFVGDVMGSAGRRAVTTLLESVVDRERVDFVVANVENLAGGFGITAKVLEELEIPFEVHVMSAHRTPDALLEYVTAATDRGIEVIVAGAGGAAHLPGVIAAKTILPVLGVPIESKALRGLDSLLSMVQMPAGVPVGTLAIGKAGASNAARWAAAILSARHRQFGKAIQQFRREQAQAVLDQPDPREQR